MNLRFGHIVLIGGMLMVSLFSVKCKSNHAVVGQYGKLNTSEDNPTTDAKAELGKKLFFDKRLSLDNTVSCATCHIPSFGFTDRKKVSDGVLGRKTDRNSPSLLNAGYLPTVMFDGHLTSLEMQVIVPIQEHVEMGMKMSEVIERLKAVPEYQKVAREIFNRDFDPWVLTRSISAFERTLFSVNSRFDQYYYGKNSKAMTSEEIKGWKLFSEKLYCTSCHPAPYFTTYKVENNGLYVDYGQDEGRFRIHHDSSDIGKFKVPSLRNIELTFPYMHDGSISSIEEILVHYEKGGMKHWNQNKVIVPFKLSSKEKNQLKAFLFALTDTSYMINF